MQYFQEHLKTMVYAKFGGQTECIMGNWKIVNGTLECSGVSDSPGKETLIYTTIFGIKTETSQFFPFLTQGDTNPMWVYD